MEFAWLYFLASTPIFVVFKRPALQQLGFGATILEEERIQGVCDEVTMENSTGEIISFEFDSMNRLIPKE